MNPVALAIISPRKRNWSSRRFEPAILTLMAPKWTVINRATEVGSLSLMYFYFSVGLFALFILCITITTFDATEQKAFLKILREKEKMLVTSIFSFSHNVFYPMKGKFNVFEFV